MASKVSELTVEGPEGTGAGTGKGVDEAGAKRAVVEVEGAKAGAGKDEATAAEAGAGKDEARVDGAVVEVEEAEVGRAEDGGASDLLPLAFWGPRKVTEGSSRFQQFFFT